MRPGSVVFICLMVASLTGSEGALAGQLGSWVETDIDRPGLDYKDFDLSEARPELCQAACTSESNCKAYTYVKPAIQGPQARCWLKSSVPAPVASQCCVSGVKADAFSPSEEQTKFLNDDGFPEYLTITVDTKTGNRQEVWAYPTKLQKAYVFYDGVRVREKPNTVDGSRLSKPPLIDPRHFAKGTTKSDIQSRFGEGFTKTMLSDVGVSAPGLALEVWYYELQGLIVSFLGEEIVSVQTVDIP